MPAVQGWVEGGFMGRTNKLVDGCYSFWQGGLFPLLRRIAPDLSCQLGVPSFVGAPLPGTHGLGTDASDDLLINNPEMEPQDQGRRTIAGSAQTAYEGRSRMLRVPPLPELSAVLGPAEQARQAAGAAQVRCSVPEHTEQPWCHIFDLHHLKWADLPCCCQKTVK